MIKTIALFVAVFGVSVNCSSQEAFSYPGGVAELRISKESEHLPDVRFGLNEPVILEYKNHWRILIGLGLDTLPGEYIAYIKSDNEGASGIYEKVIVKQHIYPFKEHRELDDKTSRQAVLKTHESYSDLDYSNTQQPSLPLKWPLEGSWSNNFGHKLYDTKSDTLHTPNAIVFHASKLTIVVAPQTAIVSKVEISDSGQATVFLDHGRGLYSILSGLSDLTVELGNGIVAGAVIGKLTVDINAKENNASSNRLVWQTVLNKTFVDPQVLTKLEP